jgi:hypothetical protein
MIEQITINSDEIVPTQNGRYLTLISEKALHWEITEYTVANGWANSNVLAWAQLPPTFTIVHRMPMEKLKDVFDRPRRAIAKFMEKTE